MEIIEEALEYIWVLEEQEENTVENFLKVFDKDILERLVREGYIKIKGNGEIKLIGRGRKIAKKIIRRHRLAEVLLTTVFDVEKEASEGFACKFEHIIDEELTDKICTFLGHPALCPHGKEIPRGECCLKYTKEVKSIIIPLQELEIGKKAEIVYTLIKDKSLLERFSSLGLQPKRVVELKQKFPSFTIKLGSSLISFDREVAKSIYVKPLD